MPGGLHVTQASSTSSAAAPGNSEAVWPSSPRPSRIRSKRGGLVEAASCRFPAELTGGVSAEQRGRMPRLHREPTRRRTAPPPPPRSARRSEWETPATAAPARPPAASAAPCRNCCADRPAARTARRRRRYTSSASNDSLLAGCASRAYVFSGVAPPERTSVNRPRCRTASRAQRTTKSAASAASASESLQITSRAELIGKHVVT